MCAGLILVGDFGRHHGAVLERRGCQREGRRSRIHEIAEGPRSQHHTAGCEEKFRLTLSKHDYPPKVERGGELKHRRLGSKNGRGHRPPRPSVTTMASTTPQ